MLKKTDWIVDPRPLRTTVNTPIRPWQEWIDDHYRTREHWLMSIIDYLIKNKDWAGGYLLIRAYIATCKQKEGVRPYNTSPVDESPHIRAVRFWFFSIVENHGFAIEEETAEKTAYEEEDNVLVRRRKTEASEIFPFVGGVPKRRYSESAEFFQQVASEREIPRKRTLRRHPEEDDKKVQ